eukprot:g24.t1
MSVSDSVAKTQASLQRWERVRSLFGLKNAFRRIAPDTIATVSYQALRKLFDSIERADDDEYYAFAKVLKEYVPDFLPDIPLENYIAICRGLELVRYEPGEIVVSLGDVPDAWYFIVSGVLDVYRNDDDAKEKKGKLASKKFGSHFGEMAFFSNAKRRTATVCSSHLGRSVVLKVRKFKYEKYIMALHKDEAKIMERQSFFNKCKMLRGLTPSAIIQLSYSVKEHKYEPFTEIRKQGEDFHCVFAIISGNLSYVHKFPDGRTADVNLATLGRTHLAGFVDYISCKALDPYSIPYHRCAVITGRDGAHVYKISSLSFSNVVMAKLGNEFLELAKIRKSFEVMRISNAIKHPHIRVNVTTAMLEAYGYVGTRAIEVLKETRSSTMEQESKKRVFKRANQARDVYKEGLDMLKNNQNVVNETIAKRLRHASILFKDASELAMKDNMVRRGEIAKTLSEECMIPVHRHTYNQSVLHKTGSFIGLDDAIIKLNEAKHDNSLLMSLENICRSQLKYWAHLHSFAFYHSLKDEEMTCTENMKGLAHILNKISMCKANLRAQNHSHKFRDSFPNVKKERSFRDEAVYDTSRNIVKDKQELSINIPSHELGHTSLHGKMQQTSIDLLNITRRTHTMVTPKLPQNISTSIKSKRLHEITNNVKSFLEEQGKQIVKGHIVPSRPLDSTSKRSSFRGSLKKIKKKDERKWY